MKGTIFFFETTYIESVIAFCDTVDVVDVQWYDDCLIVKYN